MTLVQHSCELPSAVFFERTENVLLDSMNSSLVKFALTLLLLQLRYKTLTLTTNLIPSGVYAFSIFFSRGWLCALSCRINDFFAVDGKNASLVDGSKLQSTARGL